MSQSNTYNAEVCETKYDTDDSEKDDCYQEVVVNGSDFREQIYEFETVRDLPIIKCIGQLKSEWNYSIENDYKTSATGTGTVYAVTPGAGIAFVLTCAHEQRQKIFECPDCHTYNISRQCSKCNTHLKSKNKKYIRPTLTQFRRRTTTEKDFGLSEKRYNCSEVYVPEAYEAFETNATLHRGFDFAILMFSDDDEYYAEHCHGITLGIGKETLEKHKKFGIFGYPGSDVYAVSKDKMYGYMMTSGATKGGNSAKKHIDFVECQEPKGNFTKKTEHVLRQCHIDASAGQSGAAAFVLSKETNETIIFGVHVGGHKKDAIKVNDYAYNVVTLLSEEYIHNLEKVSQMCEFTRYVFDGMQRKMLECEETVMECERLKKEVQRLNEEAALPQRVWKRYYDILAECVVLLMFFVFGLIVFLTTGNKYIAILFGTIVYYYYK